MTRCYCIDCHPNQADMRAFTFSEQHRAECEAREVLRMYHDARQAYYAEVSEKRGEAAALQLVEDVKVERARDQDRDPR